MALQSISINQAIQYIYYTNCFGLDNRGFLYIKCRMDSMEAGPVAVLMTPVVLRVSLEQGLLGFTRLPFWSFFCPG